MVRHQKYKDGLGNEFNCAFTSEFIEINEQNCIIGSAYLLAIKVAICIRDVNGRLTDYWTELDSLQDTVHVWLQQEYKKGRGMVGEFKVSEIKDPDRNNIHLQAFTTSEQRRLMEDIGKLQMEIKLSKIKLPTVENLTFIRDTIVDKIFSVTGAQRKKGERLIAPWFSIPNVSQYKFKPTYITHNNVGFTTSLSRLRINMIALRDTLNTCAKYNNLVNNVKEINKVLERLKKTGSSDTVDRLRGNFDNVNK